MRSLQLPEVALHSILDDTLLDEGKVITSILKRHHCHFRRLNMVVLDTGFIRAVMEISIPRGNCSRLHKKLCLSVQRQRMSSKKTADFTMLCVLRLTQLGLILMTQSSNSDAFTSHGFERCLSLSTCSYLPLG